MASYLDQILNSHREAADADKRSIDALLDSAHGVGGIRGFARALAGRPEGEIGVIAEIKRRSPSKGDLASDLDPAVLGSQYAAGGALCLSVLTDNEFFGGSSNDLKAARDKTDLPVLRKDFTINARDICDARLIGADAVLLIISALDDHELSDFHGLIQELGMDALVEVHDEEELERALAVEALLIGVNQRDLFTFEVDRGRAERLALLIPEGVIMVAESGIQNASDAKGLRDAGYDGILVGESLIVAVDRVSAVQALRHPARGGTNTKPE